MEHETLNTARGLKPRFFGILPNIFGMLRGTFGTRAFARHELYTPPRKLCTLPEKPSPTEA